MRVLYVSQYFPPEIGATQSRAWEMARGIAGVGHEVTVVTEFPNHPTGKIPRSYRWRLWTRSRESGVDVIRVPVLASTAKTFARRMAFYISFALAASVAILVLGRRRFDVAYVTSPPLFVGLVRHVLRLVAVPMVFEVRDLWPESAIQMGALRSERARKWARGLEQGCYRDARHIVAVTRGIADELDRNRDAQGKVSFVPNGVNLEIFRPGPRTGEWRRRLGVPESAFLVAYTGLHGLAHGLESLLEAAVLLRDEIDLWFALVGDGPAKSDLIAQAKRHGLTRIVFHDAVPEETLAEFLREIDVGVDTRRNLPITRGTLPVKLFSYWAVGIPVVAAIAGEGASLVEESGAGRVVGPENAAELATAIRWWRDHPQERANAAPRGRTFVAERFDRRVLAEGVARILEAVH
ncbi:MAG: glycosyltransferase family 4 protein [bacterium]